jgi:hypothetical protein
MILDDVRFIRAVGDFHAFSTLGRSTSAPPPFAITKVASMGSPQLYEAHFVMVRGVGADRERQAVAIHDPHGFFA